MSFREYYKNKKGIEIDEKEEKGGFREYYEARQKAKENGTYDFPFSFNEDNQKQETTSTSNSGGGGFMEYHNQYMQRKEQAAKLAQQADNANFTWNNDTTVQDLKTDIAKNKKKATQKAKETKKKKENFFDKVGDAAETVGNAAAGAVKATGNFLKGTAKGFGSGAVKGAKWIYDNTFGTDTIDNLNQVQVGNKTLKGQEAVDFLNSDEYKAFRDKDTIYKLGQNGDIIAENGIDRVLNSAIDHLKIDDKDSTAEKIGGTVGDVVNQVGQLGTIGQATAGLKLANNPMLNKMLQGGVTGAANSLMNSGVNGEEDLATIAKDAARSGLLFTVGTGASEATGAAIEKALLEKGLQNSIPAYIGQEVAKGAAFSLAGEAATLPTYPLLGDKAPTLEQVATETATGALYDIVGGLLHIPGLKKQSKAVIKQAQETLGKSGEMISQLERMGHSDVNTMNTLYDAMQRSIKQTRDEVLNARLLGQEAEVQQYIRDLDNISNDLYNRQELYQKLNAAQSVDATNRLNSYNPVYERVSKPYTNIDNGVINQSGKDFTSIPYRTETNVQAAKDVEPKKNIPKTENLTESKIEQNKAIPKADNTIYQTAPEIDKETQIVAAHYNTQTNKAGYTVLNIGEKFKTRHYSKAKGEWIEDHTFKGITNDGWKTYIYDENGNKFDGSEVISPGLEKQEHLIFNPISEIDKRNMKQVEQTPLETPKAANKLSKEELNQLEKEANKPLAAEQNNAIQDVEKPKQTFTVKRLNEETNKLEDMTFSEGEKVRNYSSSRARKNGKGKYEVDTVTGVYSTEGKSFIINQNGTYVDTQFIEKDGSLSEQVTTETKSIKDARNTFSVERLNRDTNKFEPDTFERGETVKVFMGRDSETHEPKYSIDVVKGIRHIDGKTFMVNESGNLIEAASVYKLEESDKVQTTPQATEPPKTALSNVLEQVNAKGETEFTEADRVPQEERMTYTAAKDIMSRMRKGDSTLDEVKKAYEFVRNNESIIKAAARKMTVPELRKELGSFYSGSTKKEDLVNAYYEDHVTDIIHILNGGKGITLTYSFGANGPESKAIDQYKKQADELINSIDEETYNGYMTKRKANIEERKQQRTAARKSVEQPETLEDFKKAKTVRKLTKEEQRTYDRLKAQDEKVKAKEEKEKKAAEREQRAAEYKERRQASVDNGEIPAYTITEDKHDKTGDKLYVLKFDEKLDSEAFKKASAYIKSKGGYYSRYKKGYIFKNYPSDLMPKVEDAADIDVEVQETEVTETAPTTQAEKLRHMADRLQEEIDYGRADRLENTAKRQREAASARDAADRAEEKQRLIRKIADKAEAGELVYLDELTAATQLDNLLMLSNKAYYEERNRLHKETGQYVDVGKDNIDRVEIIDNVKMPLAHTYKEHLQRFAEEAKDIPGCKQDAAKLIKFFNKDKEPYTALGPSEEDLLNRLVDKTKDKDIYIRDRVKDTLMEQKRLYNMGIHSDEALREALRELETIKAESKVEKTPEQIKARKLKELENQAANSKIAGYFPTPKKIVADMIALAEIQPEDKVLEPSAGSGDIADEIGVGKVDVVEWNGLLRQILQEKGHNIVGNDALAIEGKYDKIIMNPPFEKNQDIQHVTKMFNENLNDGGRIVAITSNHFTFANDKPSQEFRELIEENEGYYFPLPEGSFKESRRSTGVNTCMVVLFKENGIQEMAAGLEQKVDNILAAQTEAIQTKEVMAQQAKKVVDFLKAQKDGKKPMKIYFSPELSGVDNIRAIGQYLKFTDNPRDYKLDTFQIDLADDYPEVRDMGLEEFGTWLVDQVTKFREDKKLLAEAELSYKETFNKLNISPKDMQSVKKLKSAIEEVEKKMHLFPLDLQFFAEQQIKQYKSLLKQLQSEGVSQATMNRVAQMQREYKAAVKALEAEKVKNEQQLEALIEKQKTELEAAKEKLEYKAEKKLNAREEELKRQKKTAVEKQRVYAAYEKEALKQRINNEKAKLAVEKFKNISEKNMKKVKSCIKEIKQIDKNPKLNPEIKEAIHEIVQGLEGKSISSKSDKALEKLNKALDNMKAYETTPGISDAMKERIAEVKAINTDLTFEEFMDVYNSVNVLVKQNEMQNKFMNATRHQTLDEAALEVDTRLKARMRKVGRGIKVHKNGVTTYKDKVLDKVHLSQLQIKNLCVKLEGVKPGPLKTYLYDNIVKGHTAKYAYIKKSIEFFADKLKTVDMKKINKDTYELKVNENGAEHEVLKISSLEKIALALNSKNEKNRYSLIEAGFVRNNTETLYRISDKELDLLVANLNKDEQTIVNAIFEYFETLNHDQINGYTLPTYNYYAATEKWYYPKETPKSYVRIVETADLDGDKAKHHTGARNIWNADFLKPKRKTKTPINLTNPLVVVTRMMNETAELTAYGAPMRDATLLVNKVRPTIKENYSKAMYTQITDYLTAMTQPSNFMTESDKIANKLYNNVVTAIFALNTSTPLKQPLGLINAATEIEGKYLLKAMGQSPIVTKKERELIYEYAPYLWYRNQGHINKDMSETNMKESVNRTFYNKKAVREYATIAITKSDMFVAHRIWRACEAKVRKTTNLKPGSEEFYRAVGEMTTEIVLTTQSSGEVTHRSQLMRGDNIFKKSFTAFQGQLQIGLNQLDYAFEEFRESKNIGRYVKKFMLAMLIPIVATKTIEELIKLGRGRDDGLYTKYKYAEQSGIGMEELQAEVIEELIGEILSYNVFTGRAYDAVQSASYFGSSSSHPLYRELQNLAKSVDLLKKEKYEDAFEYASESMLKLLGMPIDNVQNIAAMKNAYDTDYVDLELTDDKTFEKCMEIANGLNDEKLDVYQKAAVQQMQNFKARLTKIDDALEVMTDQEQIEEALQGREELLKTAIQYFKENEKLMKG